MLTEEFRDAFERQRGALGLDAAAVYVPHPIQNKTTAELRTLADRSADAVIEALVEAAPPA